jgi:hypothetical protein
VCCGLTVKKIFCQKGNWFYLAVKQTCMEQTLQPATVTETRIEQLLSEGYTLSQIEEQLSEAEKQEAATFIQKKKFEKRKTLGAVMAAAGGFLCVFGFFITMFLMQQDVNFHVALYSVTGLGGSLLLGGMIAVMA